ncbi:cupin domain-containing protein [Archangium violaceum]|uniref:cupin domain-containing protein n=1 Tax=Archangium violaceum TaxID=83451 RepID=UPI00194FA31D|nr:cupin domain-containing protein [Archangium violaceum]QRN95214.1 cupin domain-containing protein [Archangium violaceum]
MVQDMWNPEKEHEAIAALFGGKGIVRVWNLYTGEFTPPFTAVLACELEPGGSVGPHVQKEDDELVLALEGHGAAYVDGQRVALEPGSLVGLAVGKTLALENASSETALRYLIIKAR